MALIQLVTAALGVIGGLAVNKTLKAVTKKKANKRPTHMKVEKLK